MSARSSTSTAHSMSQPSKPFRSTQPKPQDNHDGTVTLPAPQWRDIELQVERDFTGEDEVAARKGEKGLEGDLVVWDGPDDPSNPQNFPRGKKIRLTLLFGLTTMCATFVSV